MSGCLGFMYQPHTRTQIYQHTKDEAADKRATKKPITKKTAKAAAQLLLVLALCCWFSCFCPGRHVVQIFENLFHRHNNHPFLFTTYVFT
jgi:hypothetical protein